MTRCIVFANRKGGCGKTTSAVNTAHCLAAKGRKVLLIDIDPQAHATISTGKNPGAQSRGIYDLLTGQAGLEETITRTDLKNLSIIPSSPDLTAFEIDFSTCKGSENILSEKILSRAMEFDYLILDPPPTIGLLTVSALVAAQEVYIPMPMHFLAMEGLAEMMRLIYKVNALWNPELRMKGIIPTFFNKNTRLAKEITEDICKNFGKDRLLPGIRMNISLAEAPGYGKTVIEYAPQSSGAKDYMALAEKIDRK
ncbi:AAA ATPase-like domain-containing protein [Desulfonema limicola]|uniref:AAA ATPase-like domain-containing protein n=1 Tax=Desulfonema limicola TaxID=45656 RepID=A0A975B362_9BACT|nr:ParA family protein [Desulfonema limicola]QTA77934.1 AAA ATPase-like domain-containing protein [Desulfonema limicola]